MTQDTPFKPVFRRFTILPPEIGFRGSSKRGIWESMIGSKSPICPFQVFTMLHLEAKGLASKDKQFDDERDAAAIVYQHVQVVFTVNRENYFLKTPSFTLMIQMMFHSESALKEQELYGTPSK